MKLSRRALLTGSLPLAAGAAALWRSRRLAAASPNGVEGSIVGPDFDSGHLLRSGELPKPSERVEVPVAIYGGGISGLSAAWKLARAGFRDFRLFELERRPGGTSAYGRSPVTDYPWGAHYVPVPGPEASAVRELFGDLGVITGRTAAGEPIFDERYLCFAPHERLFQYGRWREGLYPALGATAADLAELAAFRREMRRYRHLKGSDGRKAFTLPMESSSRDPALLALDRMSMRQYLDSLGLSSSRLRWYVEYACRDDYGCTLETTSAWAGVFYYASRAADDDEDERPRGGSQGPSEAGQVLTWPAGNGWIVRRLEERFRDRISPRSLVCRVRVGRGDRVEADVFDLASRRMKTVVSRCAILALPKYVVARLMPDTGPWQEFTYSPWVVANVWVDALPQGRGAPPSWDNVFHASESLGYITATHQHLSGRTGASVLTWYLPLCREEPAAARARMLATPWEEWRRQIVADLSRGHPGIERDIRRIDVMLWGHAMVRPTPGFIWGPARQASAALPSGPVFFAHADLSGLPLFEEAQYRGIAAAERALTALRIPFQSSL